MATRPAGAPARRPRGGTTARSRALPAAHVAVGLMVLVGVLAQVVRPLAPDIGPVIDPTAWFDLEHLDRVRSYRGPRYAVGLVALAIHVAVPLSLVVTARGRRLVERVAARAGRGAAVDGGEPAATRRPATAAAAIVVGALVATDLLLLPLAFWTGYVHEGAFGFRTHGPAGWAADWLVVRAQGWVAAAVLTLAGYTLARRLPRAWPPVAALTGAALVAVVVFGSPLALEPLRQRTEPLAPGAVRAEVERVLQAAGEDVGTIVVADASRRTTKLNAYVSGLGATRRIVLYDTLVENRPPQEVGLILAHELGHHQHADVRRAAAGGAAGIAALTYALAWLLRRRTAAGRQAAVTDPRGAAVALLFVVALSAAGLPLQQVVSRRAEAAADHAALRITEDPQTFLAAQAQLARANLADPSPPWWAYLLWYSHPPVTHRLTMGQRWVEATAGEPGPGSLDRSGSVARAPGAR